MARKKKRPTVPCQAPIGLPLTKMQLPSYAMEDSSTLDFRQAPIGAIRLARRFGLSVATAAAVVEANGWGCA